MSKYIITEAGRVTSTNFDFFVSSGLRRLQNASYATKKIIDRHQVSSKQHANASKQGEQLSYCVSLALNYAAAASSASLAIKPVLIYYAMLNFALAEVLIKQDGRSSLDLARAQNAHHGLEIAFSLGSKTSLPLKELASRLKARPHLRSGQRSGTFELWHRTAREHPAIGKISQPGSVGYRAVLFPADQKLPELPESGIDLLTALSMSPSMRTHLAVRALDYDFCRGIAFVDQRLDGTRDFNLVLHPDSEPRLEKVTSRLLFSSAATEHVQIAEQGSGIALRMEVFQDGVRNFRLPAVCSLSRDELLLSLSEHPVNEFGAFYISFFILGNLCRYFADHWMKEVNDFTDFASLCEALCAEFFTRIPALVLSEIEQVLFVREG
jgi:hypothetical protein